MTESSDAYLKVETKTVPASPPDPLLSIQGLKTYFYTDKGVLPAVDDVSLTAYKGRVLGIVGESGCGKSMTALSILRLIPSPPGRIVGGRIMFDGRNILDLSVNEMCHLRGNEISMIFQEPMTSLNPVYTVGRQVMEVSMLHRRMNRTQAREEAVRMFKLVGIPEAEKRIDVYPHQLSGGLRQRVMIAMVLSCRPKLLIADEPTTALDVTVQAQILKLMRDLQREIDSAIILITHDLGVVAEMCDEVLVMYAGRVVEQAQVFDLFDNPRHPYTEGLLKSIPKLHQDDAAPLYSIKGMVPSLLGLDGGCRFHPRCEAATELCVRREPEFTEVSPGHQVRCWKYRERGESL